jgi:hypothetical protein
MIRSDQAGMRSVRAEKCSIRLGRGEFLWGLMILATANGLFGAIIASINRDGWNDALFASFNISVIVWLASAAGLYLARPDQLPSAIQKSDFVVGLACLALVCLPIGPSSWLALTVLSIWLLRSRQTSAAQRRGAIILLAVTVPMLWSRILFQVFATKVLATDAAFVSWMLGTARIGNMVQFVDGSGYLVIFPACSSLANLSLALLCWITLVQLVKHRQARTDVVWTVLLCLAVVALNVGRMAFMATNLEHYEALHTSFGIQAENVLFLLIIVGICSLGLRNEIFARV